MDCSQRQVVIDILSDGIQRDALGILESADKRLNPKGFRTLLERMIEEESIIASRVAAGEVYSLPKSVRGG